MVHTKVPKATKSRRNVLSDETYLQLREILLTNEIAPAERLNIDELARQLDVSQTPVREALARLESDDLVTKQPLRGYHATSLLTAGQIQDLFQFRGLIEPWAAMKAAQRIDAQGSQRIRQELLRGKSAEKLDIDKAYSAMSEHDARFHNLIAELSGNPFVHDSYVRTHCHLHLIRLYTVLKTRLQEPRADAAVVSELFDLYYNPTSGFLALREHELIAKAVMNGDDSTARVLMLEHIENSLSRFGQIMSAMEASK